MESAAFEFYNFRLCNKLHRSVYHLLRLLVRLCYVFCAPAEHKFVFSTCIYRPVVLPSLNNCVVEHHEPQEQRRLYLDV